ncbi:uncharacterized protein V1510DRAFT_416463 [Dipodascopsis tothii]|uniref:uncharacterized protein n=1 Tax=Dipodascopsis tothii TaxID=44089 RepID=UPI0034CD845B
MVATRTGKGKKPAASNRGLKTGKKLAAEPKKIKQDPAPKSAKKAKKDELEAQQEFLEIGSDDEEVSFEFSEAEEDPEDLTSESEAEAEAEAVAAAAADAADSDSDDAEPAVDDKKSARELKLSKEKEEQIKAMIAAKRQSAEKEQAEPKSETKKTKKEKKAAREEKPGVIYIGRIPHGFYEEQMRGYFSQFGDITRLRMSRNKKTGRSKHYAFVEFESSDVAEIVAETMNNYLLYGHILKVAVVPEDRVHEKLWQGSDKKFKVIPRAKVAKYENDRKRSAEDWEILTKKEEKRRKSKMDKLKELGIDYKIPIKMKH